MAEDLLHVLPLLHPNAVKHCARGRDAEKQGLGALADGGLDDIVDSTRLVRVKLIDDGAVGVESVKRSGIGALRHEARVCPRHDNRVRED